MEDDDDDLAQESSGPSGPDDDDDLAQQPEGPFDEDFTFGDDD